MNEKGYIAIVPIVPLLFGMAFLAIGFILYPLLGLWALVVVVLLGIVGMFVGIRMIKSGTKKDKPK